MRQRRVHAAADHLANDLDVGRGNGIEQRQLRDRRIAAERVVEQRERDPPGLADRGVAAGERHGTEGGEAGALAVVATSTSPPHAVPSVP